MSSKLLQGFLLGPWKVEPLRGAVSGPNGESHHLEPKVMDVFVCLAGRANELVTRNQLLDVVWSETTGSDEQLTRAIGELRRVLDDDPGDPTYIETVPKRGYRLIGEVRLFDGIKLEKNSERFQSIAQHSGRKAAWIITAVLITLVTTLVGLNAGNLRDRLLGGAAPVRITSIAVLPLNNLSGDPEQDYFTDGMTEALTAELGRIKALKVISRTSAMQYKVTRKSMPEIARELGVDALLEGSVLRAGDEVRITVQLIHGPTDRHLWSGSFQRNLRDILALQGEVARAITDEIQLRLTPEAEARLARARTVNPNAYELWLKGNFLLSKKNEESFRKALAYYQEAVELDPDYAQAHAGIAMAYIELGSWWSHQPPRKYFPLAKEAADRALALDPDLAEAYFALGSIRQLFEWDWEGGERAFNQGMVLDPSSIEGRLGYANFLTAMGRFEESIEIGRKTLELDPLSRWAHIELGFALGFVGRDDESLELMQELHELGLGPGPLGFVEHYVKMGDFDKAAAILPPVDVAKETLAPGPIGLIGYYYGRVGQPTEARALLSFLLERRAKVYVPAHPIANILTGLAEHDEALKWFEKAYEERNIESVWLKEHWRYDALRSDQRFQSILDRMDFPGT